MVSKVLNGECGVCQPIPNQPGEHFKTGADSDGPVLIKVWGARLRPLFQ